MLSLRSYDGIQILIVLVSSLIVLSIGRIVLRFILKFENRLYFSWEIEHWSTSSRLLSVLKIIEAIGIDF